MLPPPPPRVALVLDTASSLGWLTGRHDLAEGPTCWRLVRPGGDTFQLEVNDRGRVTWAGTIVEGRHHRQLSLRAVERAVGLTPQPCRWTA